MRKLKDIQDKIEQLKKMKLEVETKIARDIYKELEKILKDDFSYKMIISLVEETWNNASFDQKEKWRSKARTFLMSDLSKTAGSSDKNQKKAEPALQ